MPETIGMNLHNSLAKGDLNAFFEYIDLLLARIPYDLYAEKTPESFYHLVVYLAIKIAGHHVSNEVHTNKGRIDTALETGAAYYVFEFKINASAEVALGQILDRGYTKAYQGLGKRIYAVGVNFNTAKRCVDGWRKKEISPPIVQPHESNRSFKETGKINIAAWDAQLPLDIYARLMAPEEDLELVASINTSKALLDWLRHGNVVDLLVFSAKETHIGIVEKVKELRPNLKMLALLDHTNGYLIRSLTDLGCSGFMLLESFGRFSFLEAIRLIATGQASIPLAVSEALAHFDNLRGLLNSLDQEILPYISRGFTDAEVAEATGLSKAIVQKARKGMTTKLNARNTKDLIRIVTENKLFTSQ